MVFFQFSYSVAVINARANVFVFPYTSLKSTISAEAADLLARDWPCRIGTHHEMFPISLSKFAFDIPPCASFLETSLLKVTSNCWKKKKLNVIKV